MNMSNINAGFITPTKRTAEGVAAEKLRGHSLQQDTWVFRGREFRTVEGVMPKAIVDAFEKPLALPENEAPYAYDRSKLSVYCLSGVRGAKLAARVELKKGLFFIADVIPKEEVFEIQVYPIGEKLFPMTPAEFLRAILAAKLNLFLKTDDSDDDVGEIVET